MNEYYAPKRNVLQRHTSTGDVMVSRRIVQTPFGRQLRNVYTTSQLPPNYEKQRDKIQNNDNPCSRPRSMKRPHSTNIFNDYVDQNCETSSNILVDNVSLIGLQEKYDSIIAKQEKQILELRREVELALSMSHGSAIAVPEDFNRSPSYKTNNNVRLVEESNEHTQSKKKFVIMKNEYEKKVDTKDQQIEGLKKKLFNIHNTTGDSQMDSVTEMSLQSEADMSKGSKSQTFDPSTSSFHSSIAATINDDGQNSNSHNKPLSLNMNITNSLSGTASPIDSLRRSLTERNLQLAEAIVASARASAGNTTPRTPNNMSGNKFDIFPTPLVPVYSPTFKKNSLSMSIDLLVDSALHILGLSTDSSDFSEEHVENLQEESLSGGDVSTTTPTVSSVSNDSEEFLVTTRRKQSTIQNLDQQKTVNFAQVYPSSEADPPLKALKSYVKTANDLCKIFGVSNTKVFDGEMLMKKLNTDFMFKESFVWLNLSTKSIHWTKAAKDKCTPDSSKFMLMKKSKILCATPNDVRVSAGGTGDESKLEDGGATKKLVTKPNMGIMKGIIRTAIKMPGGKGVIIITEEGSYLELKLPPESVTNWLQVLRLLL